MRTFGLTGGIGAGKSTVARWLREHHGIPVIDADQLARDVVAPGTPGLAAVVDAFGAEVLGPDGGLDRAAMRARVMADPAARARLEGITHPRIFEALGTKLRALADQGHDLVGVEAALMVETGSWRLYDAVVVVSAPPDVQVQRVVARDRVAPDGARAVLAAQASTADRESVATYVITNDGDLDALHRRVDEVVAQLRA